MQGLESFVNTQTNLKPSDDRDELESLPSFVSEAAIREDFNTNTKSKKSTLADNPKCIFMNDLFSSNHGY